MKTNNINGVFCEYLSDLMYLRFIIVLFYYYYVSVISIFNIFLLFDR
jgi:hypothetical protein